MIREYSKSEIEPPQFSHYEPNVLKMLENMGYDLANSPGLNCGKGRWTLLGLLFLEGKHLTIVMPRSHGYGDVTATYIRRSEIPSHIYAKHQCRQESEFGNTWCIIHSNIWIQLESYHHMWHNITRILHHWYHNCENTRRYTSMNNTKGRSRVCRSCCEPTRGARKGLELQLACPLRKVSLVLSKRMIHVSPSSET